MLVVRQTMTLVASGLVAGVGLALLVSRALRAFLYGVPAVDVASFLAVAGLLTGVALIACYVPARRATIIDPLKALRQE
jgi:putative ABC transport system permease protein